MYQTNQTDASFLLIAIIITVVISLLIIFFIIKYAVKSAVNEELSRTNALIEWYLAKKYPEIKNIRGRSKLFAQLSKEKEENYTMLQTGARKEEKYKKLESALQENMDKCMD